MTNMDEKVKSENIMNKNSKDSKDNKKSKKNNNKKKNKTGSLILKIDIALAIIIFFGIFYTSFLSPLKLNGENQVSHKMGTKYVDAGSNHRFAKLEGKVNVNKEGEYVIKYKLLNQSVERKVFVVDDSRIVMGLKGASHAQVREGDPYVESGAFVIDKEKGPIKEDLIKIKGRVDSSKVGIYKVKYTYEQGGINKSMTREVEVVDKDSFDEDKDGISVMMYHYVYTEEEPPNKINSNYILAKDLEEQFKYLKESGYYFPSFRELKAYIDGKIALPAKSVVLTFDDGQYGFLKYGIPLAEKYKIPITAYLIGTKNGAEIVKQNASTYVQFQSHSYDMHRAGGNIGHNGIISAMSKKDIVSDLKKSISEIGNNESFAYPFGDYTEDAKEASEEAGIICSFTTEYDRVRRGSDYRILPRIRVSGDNIFNTWKQSL